jgi:hypothetical protein
MEYGEIILALADESTLVSGTLCFKGAFAAPSGQAPPSIGQVWANASRHERSPMATPQHHDIAMPMQTSMEVEEGVAHIRDHPLGDYRERKNRFEPTLASPRLRLAPSSPTPGGTRRPVVLP